MFFDGSLPWVGFFVFVFLMLLLDLGFHRKAHDIKLHEALLWSVFWIGLTLAFNGWVYVWRGSEAALKFLTGYILERSLSMDNLFVFMVILTYFSVPTSN
jgi:tellurite resistance protein TerC